MITRRAVRSFPRSRFTAPRMRALTLALLAAGASAFAAPPAKQVHIAFLPGYLVLSRSVYDNRSSNVQPGQVLPPNCAQTKGACAPATGAPYDGTYPTVWNNDLYDSSFGITSEIVLDEITTDGAVVGTLEVPNNRGNGASNEHLVTSFSSKSELALHLSTDGQYLTFMGYVAPVDMLDVSNSNTPGVIDPTNPVGQNIYRAIARVDSFGNFDFTETNAYSGNNGRSVILNNLGGKQIYYTAGNAGNGGSQQPDGVILGAGAQFVNVSGSRESKQNPGTPTPLASFSITQLGVPADKIGKDDNFRGMTIHDNVVYYTKGSGGNGVNTVYFVDTTGSACPTGVGVPAPNASLPGKPLAYDPTKLQTNGLPSNMCILAGFPSTPNKSAKTLSYPFGLWFADDDTLYVADEGDGNVSDAKLYTNAAAQTSAGLQKWVFDKTAKQWKLAYTLQNGLNLGVPYAVPNYPTGMNATTNLPWAPATDGLRNLTGRVNDDGTATIWAVTSTVSGNGDIGADPNMLVRISDTLTNTDATVGAKEQFAVLRTAASGEVLRGVSFTPGTASR